MSVDLSTYSSIGEYSRSSTLPTAPSPVTTHYIVTISSLFMTKSPDIADLEGLCSGSSHRRFGTAGRLGSTQWVVAVRFSR